MDQPPFLSHLGVAVQDQAVPPTVQSFPIRFNQNNYKLWGEAVAQVKIKSARAAWGQAIKNYVDLCLTRGVYPFTGTQQSTNDQIFNILKDHRRDLVHFINQSKILDLVTIKSTTREVLMTTTGFGLRVDAQVVLKDPTFPQWLFQNPMPNFSIIRDGHTWHKNISTDCVFKVYNEGTAMVGRWHIAYEVHVAKFPDIPGNDIPSQAELEQFVLQVLYLPLLRAHRPFGMTHRLI